MNEISLKDIEKLRKIVERKKENMKEITLDLIKVLKEIEEKLDRLI